MRFKWNPKNHSQYKYKRRVAFCYWWCCCCVVGWVGNEDENSSAPSSREENNIFIIFQQLQTHTYETVSFPTLSIRFSLSLYTVEFTLAAFARCRGHGLCINAILCSWNFIRMLLMYTAKKSIKIYGNVGNIIQFSLCLWHISTPTVFSHSFCSFSSVCTHFLQPLVYLSQPDFSEALKTFFFLLFYCWCVYFFS